MEPLDDLDLPIPEGHLHAFMDGELDVQSEQPLFDELAANPALRGEMRDVLTIRNAVHRDLVSPPASAEAAVMAAAGLTTAAAGTSATATAATAAATAVSPLGLALRYGVGGLLLGAAVVYFMMSGAATEGQSNVVSLQPAPIPSTSVAGAARVDTIRVPVASVDQFAVDAQRRALAAERYQLAQAWQDLRSAQAAFVREQRESNQTPVAPSEPAVAYAQPTVAVMMMQSTATRPAPATAFATKLFTVAEPLPLQIRFRTLASGLRSEEAVPASVRDAALPNTALSISLPLTEEHRLGVEFGREAFRQQFRSTLNGRPVEYLQTPTLFWFGANYQFVAQSIFGLDGLRPFVESTVGYALEQGPLARAAAGLQYRPIGPIAFSLGFDASALSFQQDGRWLSTTKTGFTTGISIDVGSWP